MQVCILNLIPVFVVGKPGSSKTLTLQVSPALALLSMNYIVLALQVIASNLQGKQSQQPFWHQYPSVYIFAYQCSPLSTAEGIEQQFDIATRYQTHAQDCITVLLLDEGPLSFLSCLPVH